MPLARHICRSVVLVTLAFGSGKRLVGQDVEGPPADATLELTDETFDYWRNAICPSDDEERWRDVPWRTSFWRGVLDSHRERKPIVLWVMNGHPLGHT